MLRYGLLRETDAQTCGKLMWRPKLTLTEKKLTSVLVFSKSGEICVALRYKNRYFYNFGILGSNLGPSQILSKIRPKSQFANENMNYVLQLICVHTILYRF